ncbi:hypothetical protein HDU81_004058 [Chytriomyces hyalinus]|nr:hypothetical protein HDU81_004058 [Chytriomyces hyalinus]
MATTAAPETDEHGETQSLPTVTPFIAANAPPSNAWRQSITLTAKRTKDSIIHVSSIRVPNIEKYSTSVHGLGETPYIAVGCASESNNLFIVENLSAPKLNSSETPETTGLKTRSAFSVPDPIYKLSFSGNLLLTAGPNARLQLFKIDLAEIGNRGKGLEHAFDCKLNSGKLSDVKVAPPGTRVASVRVHDAELMPVSRGTPSPKFLALEGRKVFIWDIEGQKVVASEMTSFDQLMCASWSPHQPYGSLMAVSGVDHHLSVLDARLMGMDTDKSVVWKVERAHGGKSHAAITAVKFNPFIPHWLASAGEDSVVRLWDLRYLKNPAAKIEGHYQGLQSMAWSTTHGEILMTGSNDCTARAWSFDASVITPIKSSQNLFIGSPSTEWGDPEFRSFATTSKTDLVKRDAGIPDGSFCVGAKMIADVTAYSGPVVSLAASTNHLDTFFTLSSIGELSAITLRPELFQATSPHRFDASEAPIEHSIETAVFSRNLSSAFEKLIHLSKTSLAERRTFGKHEKKMIDLCTAKVKVDPASWALANRGGVSMAGSLRKIVGPWKEEGKEGGKEMVDRFRLDLENVTYHIPPGFGDMRQWYNLIPDKTKTELEMVILRYNTLVDVSKKNYENVLKAEDAICQSIVSEPSMMEPDFLKILVECVLPNDFIRGLSMGYNMSQTVDISTPSQSPSRFPQLTGLISLLLFPTVFEPATWTMDPSNLERKWSDGRGPRMRQTWVRGFLDESARLAAIQKSVAEGHSKKSVRVTGISAADVALIEEDRKRVAVIGQLMGDAKGVLKMVQIEIQVAKLLAQNSQNEDIADELIRIVSATESASATDRRKSGAVLTHENALLHKVTISATTNRLFMDALLLKCRFEEYFLICHDFCINYQPYEFPSSILRHAETTAIPKLQSYIDACYTKATSHVAEAVQIAEKASSQPNSVVGQAMTVGIKPLRDGLNVVVKIGLTLAQLMEMKGVFDRDGVELSARCFGALNQMLTTLFGSLFKVLDQMDRMFGKLGTAGAYARDAASNANEELKTICKAYSKPSEAKTRAAGAIIASATGANVKDSCSGAVFMEEVFSGMEKLGKISRPQV